MPTRAARPRTIAIVVGEGSGDALGADLMAELKMLDPDIRFVGVAGEDMTRRGMASLFPVSDIAVMGFGAVVARLPTILQRLRQTVVAIAAAQPDALVIIDSPAFTHSLAERVARRCPRMPVIDYVSPSVWAWKPWRARRMRRYVDHVLALLPFEPEVHRRLGGPPCTYVGHPLTAARHRLRPNAGPLAGSGQPPVLAVLPGSRRSEIAALMRPFGEAAAKVARALGDLRIVLPAVAALEPEIRQAAQRWPVRPEIVLGEAARHAAFRSATAALAASGTVTLELALAEVPMVAAYRPERVVLALKRFSTLKSVILPNIILGENVVPEFIAARIDPDALADALLPLFSESPARAAQRAGFSRLDRLMRTDEPPGRKAAGIVLAQMSAGPVRPGTPPSRSSQRRLETGT